MKVLNSLNMFWELHQFILTTFKLHLASIACFSIDALKLNSKVKAYTIKTVNMCYVYLTVYHVCKYNFFLSTWLMVQEFSQAMDFIQANIFELPSSPSDNSSCILSLGKLKTNANNYERTAKSEILQVWNIHCFAWTTKRS